MEHLLGGSKRCRRHLEYDHMLELDYKVDPLDFRALIEKIVLIIYSSLLVRKQSQDMG